jgi:hypothetical protein
MSQGQEQRDDHNRREEKCTAAYQLGVPPNPLNGQIAVVNASFHF